MAYIQNNNPFEKCACGKRSNTLRKVSKELKKASNMHAGQAKKIDMALGESPMKGKISASCKAQAKKKFKVWPSAYASGWGVRCTRGDFKKK